MQTWVKKTFDNTGFPVVYFAYGFSVGQSYHWGIYKQFHYIALSLLVHIIVFRLQLQIIRGSLNEPDSNKTALHTSVDVLSCICCLCICLLLFLTSSMLPMRELSRKLRCVIHKMFSCFIDRTIKSQTNYVGVLAQQFYIPTSCIFCQLCLFLLFCMQFWGCVKGSGLCSMAWMCSAC